MGNVSGKLEVRDSREGVFEATEGILVCTIAKALEFTTV
jgi:hypothetical protein